MIGLLRTRPLRIGRTLSVQGSHGWRADSAVFDEQNLVSHAGLVPVLELAVGRIQHHQAYAAAPDFPLLLQLGRFLRVDGDMDGGDVVRE